MDVRVTQQLQADRAVASLRRSAARQANYQQAIATGLKVRAPSDAPADFVAARQARAAADRLDGYHATAQAATGALDAGVSALLEAGRLLNKAMELAATGINGATDTASHPALAAEVDGLIDRLLTIANTEFDGRQLFGGTASEAPPFAVTARDVLGRPTVIAYQGAAERARSLIGPGQTVDTLYDGAAVFQSAGADVFAALVGVRDALRDGTLDAPARTAALTQRMGQLEAARSRALATVGEQSAALASLESARTRIEDERLALRVRAGDLDGTDYAEAILRLQEEETVYQATLATTARLFGPNLLEFLR